MTSMKEKIETIVNNAANRKPVRKYRYIKPFAVLLAAVLLCGMSGCSKNEGEISKQESSSGDSQNISSDNSIEDFEPVPVPEGGWKVESLAKTIRINGEPLPKPLTGENLGDGYKLEQYNSYNFIFINNTPVVLVRFKDGTLNPDNSKEIDMLSSSDDYSIDGNRADCGVSVNGIHVGSVYSEAQSALGKPTVERDLTDFIVWDFYIGNDEDDNNDNRFLSLNFDRSDNKVSLITFYFK